MYRVRVIYTIANSLQRTKAETQEGRKKRGIDTRDPIPRLTHLPPPTPTHPRSAMTSDQPRPKFKLPNLFDNLALIEPEPEPEPEFVMDAIDPGPRIPPGKFMVEFGGD